ncbi:MAG: hypothetical protein IAF58_20850 [Leptolyngbya sp.]|nr:hypothetical protein [Candidatus Melainabacteria bacterium]
MEGNQSRTTNLRIVECMLMLMKNLLATSFILLTFAHTANEAAAFPFSFRKKHPEVSEDKTLPTEAPISPLNIQSNAPIKDVNSNPTIYSPTAAPTFRPYSPSTSSPKFTPRLTPADADLNTVDTLSPPTSSTILPDSKTPNINHSPPILPPRPPLPPPPEVRAPIMVSTGDPPVPLAWRAIAFKLWSTPETLPSKRVKAQVSFTSATATTISALIKSLSEAGWNAPQVSVAAGHILATPNTADGTKIKLIFATKPTSNGATAVRVTTDPDSHQFDKSKIEAILTRAQDIAAHTNML